MAILTSWDFTLKSEGIDLDELKTKLTTLCSKYAFQLELSESGYEHYQGRVRLIKKMRMTNLKTALAYKEIHLSPTSLTVHKKNEFNYVLKDQTRIDGPWTDKDKPTEYVPKQYRNLVLRPWQEELYTMVKNDESTRNIYVLIDSRGGTGKSTMALYLTCTGKAEYIPPISNDAKDIMRMVYDLPTSSLYLVDLTRSFRKDKLYGLYSSIEQIKNGYVYDDRYSFKRKFIDTPGLIVFTNECPNLDYVSLDRWKLYTVNDDKLEPYNIDEIIERDAYDFVDED